MKKLFFTTILLFAVSAEAQTVTSLTLINTDTDMPIAGFDPIVSGSTINMATLPTRNINIRANVTGTVGSVVYGFDANTMYSIKNSPPYPISGDAIGTPPQYGAWSMANGGHTITARAFTMPNGAGTGGILLTIQVLVQDVPNITSYRLKIYMGTPPPTPPIDPPPPPLSQLDIPVASVTCNQPPPVNPPIPPVTNPQRWIWNDVLTINRVCTYMDTRFDGLAEGTYYGTATGVNNIGVGPEGMAVPFVRSLPQVPPAPMGVLIIP